MMKKLYKWEYKYGRFAIRNLMMIIIFGQAMVYLADMFTLTFSISGMLSLSWPAVMQGQVWRLVTFIFVPVGGSPLSLLLYLYCDYLIGHTLEMRWGDFRFNIYYLCGMLTAILGAAVMGAGTAHYLHLSFFFIFALLFSESQMLLFFIVPIKAKYIAVFSAVLLLFDFWRGGWATRMAVLMAVANFLLFFGDDLYKAIKREAGYSKTRRAWRNNKNNYRH